MLIGQSIAPQQRNDIREFLVARPEIKQVFSLITLQMGNDIMVAVQAEMEDPEAATGLSIERINAVEAAMRAKFPEIRWSFFEPDSSA
jgi:divalent metal cation (Fe/Co/Zn/Cd) transporter